MLQIFNFYINLVVQIFDRVLNAFEVTSGVGFGTFLLACSLLVVFINLLKFRFSSNGMAEIKAYNRRKEIESPQYKFHNFSNSYMEKMGYSRHNIR